MENTGLSLKKFNLENLLDCTDPDLNQTNSISVEQEKDESRELVDRKIKKQLKKFPEYNLENNLTSENFFESEDISILDSGASVKELTPTDNGEESIFSLEDQNEISALIEKEQERWKISKEQKRSASSKKSLLAKTKNQTISFIPTEELTGRSLRFRKTLTDVLIDQPDRKIHSKDIYWLIKELGGVIKLQKNRHRIFFNNRYINYFEKLHDKDPKGFLTKGWVVRVACVIEKAVRYEYIDKAKYPYFPQMDILSEVFSKP
ncbi:MAG: hypothetical protein SNF33_03755 [Candidatus Algichlamydia australiensis]|nr:hypothetical protein [Chlamydiales bacterium]